MAYLQSAKDSIRNLETAAELGLTRAAGTAVSGTVTGALVSRLVGVADPVCIIGV